MTTEEIAPHDAYRTTVDATVIGRDDAGIILDRTVFYARGGGQPGDHGSLSWDGGSVAVVDTVRRSGVPVHIITDAAPDEGHAVHASLDWDRRFRLMRTHTALHVLSAVIFGEFGARVTGGNMEPGSARMDFELDAISVDFGKAVEVRLNEVLAAGQPVTVEFLPRSEALADPDLIRTKVNLIPETVDPIRVVTIGSVDRQADGGTHVADTREVGTVRVVKTESKGRGNKRIRIELEG